MTELAVNKFVGRGVISDEFREELMARQMTKEEIAAADPNLDNLDVNAIVVALMFADDFPGFSAEITRYLGRRYRGGRPSGDNLPISV